MRSCEINLLKTFKKCLTINNRIGIAKKENGDISYRVQFSNVQLYRWLLKMGLFPAKTYTIGEIKIPDKFFIDFLRGHLDGDGSIQAYIDRYNNYKGRIYTNRRIFVRFISASEVHIKWLRGKIFSLAKVNGALIKRDMSKWNRVTMWEIKFAKKESIKLLKQIYYQKDLPCLKRKGLLAKKLLKATAHERRRKYKRIENLTPTPGTKI